MSANSEAVAIVGMGCRVPGANSPEDLWNLLLEGKDMVKELPDSRWNQKKWSSGPRIQGKHWSHHAALVDGIDMFDAPFFNLTPKEAAQLDPQIRLLLESTWCALEDAGIDLNKKTRDAGVFIGHMSHDYMDLQSTSRDTITSHAIQGNATTMAANRISYFLNQHGPSVTYNTACSSSMVALHYAVESVRSGECSWAIVGGCNALLDPRLFVAFTDWGTMSPAGRCFAFDARANGYVRGEGTATIILKPLKQALADNDRIYSVIRQTAINHDGHKRAITTPNFDAQLALMRKVYEDAHVDVKSVDYIEAHGTGTVLGDSVESRAIGTALCPADRVTPLLIGSIKTNIGHLEGAAGIISVMKTALCIYYGKIPKNLNFQTPNPEIDFVNLKLRVPTMTEMWPNMNIVRRAGVNSFGIGGSNAHAILESCDAPKPLETSTEGQHHCLCLSAQSEDVLSKMVEGTTKTWHDQEMNPQALADICDTLYSKRNGLPHRMAMVDQAAMITYYLENGNKAEIKRKVVRGTALELEKRPIVMVFCGQGTQWKEMGKTLSENCPVFRESLHRCNEVVKSKGGFDLLDFMADDRVNSALTAQPATTAIQIGLVDLLRSWGIAPSAVMGHSSGEIGACYAAGALTLEEAMECALYRGTTIEEHCDKDGGMAAIGVGVEKARELIQGYENIWIATENSPSSVTLSGSKETLEELSKNLSEDGFFVRVLEVNQAYHSPYMNKAMPHYKDLINHIHGRPLTCKFFSTVLCQEVTDPSVIQGDYFVKNLTHPVQFAPTIKLMGEEFGQAVFMEIGPHPTLHRPIVQSLESKVDENQVIGTLARDQNDVLSIKKTIAGLFCNGNDYPEAMRFCVPKANFYPGLPSYPFNRQKLWKESEEALKHRISPIVHPLLGIRESSIHPLYRSRISLKEFPYLCDHTILGSRLAPAALYLEMSLAALKDVLNQDKGSIYFAHFEQPLIVPDDELLVLFTNYDPKGNELVISKRKLVDFDYNGKNQWMEYYRCHISPETDDWCEGDPLEAVMDHFRGNTFDLEGDKIYDALATEGLDFGPTFHTLKSIHRGVNEGWCEVENTISAEELQDGYLLHPTLVDAMFQSIITTISGAPSAYVPTAVDHLSFDLSRFSSGPITVHVQQVSQGKIVEANVWMYTQSKPFLWARGAKLQAISGQSGNGLAEVLHSQKFEEVNLKPVGNPILPTASEPLVVLSTAGPSHLTMSLTELLGDACLKLEDPEKVPEHAAAFVVIYENMENESQPVDLLPLLLFTQSLLRNKNSAPLFLVTVGGNGNVTNPAVSGVIGFGRTLQNETGAFKCFLFDIDPAQDMMSQMLTVTRMLSVDFGSDREIIERANHLFAVRVVPEHIDKERKTEPEPDPCRWVLDIEKPGILESFYRKEFVERELQPHEILWEQHYGGLNYKDVMVAMGVLKEDAFRGGSTKLNLGLEGSGVVLKVGKEVKKLKPGDRCFGLCSQGCGTHSITKDAHVFKVPKQMTPEQASGVFVPYTTAYACSVKADFKQGDFVLIHGGSGGVGSCAIQLVRNAGAIAIATASTDRKKDYCQKMGAQYVFNSRNGSFFQDVMKVTKGHGCDVILNCLSDQLMKDTVRLLAPYGRFVEIGKTDAMADNQLNIHDFLENGNYIFFDLDRYLEQRFEMTTLWGSTVVELLEKGKLKPMETTVFPASEIDNAYRFLSQSHHLGKVVLQLKRDDTWVPTGLPFHRNYPFSASGAYVIAGGSRGLGLEIAMWIASLGGKHIFLVNRTGTLDVEGRNASKLMTVRYQTVVETIKCDITNRREVEDVFQSLKDRQIHLNGIIHSAMNLSDHLISSMTPEQFSCSFDPKAIGAYNLHFALQELGMEPSEFFIVFSSISSVIGNPGQVNYCAGNSYMEGLMQYRSSLGLKGCALNLGAIRDAGAVFRNNGIVSDQLKQDMISSRVIKSAILHSVYTPAEGSQYIVSRFSKASLPGEQNAVKFAEIIENAHSGASAVSDSLLKQVLAAKTEQRQALITNELRRALSKMIGVPESSIRVDQTLTTLGIDSIAAVELKSFLDVQFNTNIPVFELTAGKTIGGLIDDLMAIAEGQKSGSGSSQWKDPASSHKSNLVGVKVLQQRQEEGPQGETESDLVDQRMSNLLRETPTLGARETSKPVPISPDMNQSVCDIGETHYDFSKTKESTEVNAYVKWLKWNPYYFTQMRVSATETMIEGYDRCIDFSSYDYLGMSSNENVIKASKECIDKYGTSVSASRLTGGQIPAHMQLEKEIAALLGVEDSIVFLGGHTANVNSIKTLFTRKDLICYDEYSHNSLMEGAAYSGAQSIPFNHNDWRDLDHKLLSKRKKYEKVLIVIEGIYSMDGDIPDLPQFIRIKNKHNCILMVDEAHSIGVLGHTGRGIGEHFHILPKSVEIWMGSLGKSFANAGGYIAGQKEMVSILRYRAPGFVYSIGLSPAVAGGALRAIQELKQHPEIPETLRARSGFFKRLCQEEGIEVGACANVPSAVVSVFVGQTDKCLKVLQDLRYEGVLVTPGMWPACPQGKARLRFFINATHSEEQIRKTVTAIKKIYIKEKLILPSKEPVAASLNPDTREAVSASAP